MRIKESTLNRVRNYRVVGLSRDNTVQILHHASRTVSDTGMRPTEFGFWGLEPEEIRILRRGITAAGRDRRPR